MAKTKTLSAPRRTARILDKAAKVPADYRAMLLTGRWFATLPDALQTTLIDAAQLRPLAAQELLFARGDAPDGLYALLRGTLLVTGSGKDGREAMLALIEPPQWFGEISVFDGLPRTHDVRAQQEALLLQLPAAELAAVLERQPLLWHHLGVLMAHQLRLVFAAMEEVTLLPPLQRLARRLVLIAEGYGDWHSRKRRVIEAKQEQLAMMLSLSRQTTNQLLKELEARGLVKTTYGEIELIDLDALRRLTP